MNERHAEQTQFLYDDLCLAVVRTVNPITDADRTLSATVYALDGRGTFIAYVNPPLGISRHIRKGQIVLIGFLQKFAAYPVIIGISFNNELNSSFQTPLPPPHEYVSDQVYYHPETGAYLRFRSASATATNPGTDGSAALVDLAFASGMDLSLDEYENGTSPPNRAKASLTMPSGASLIIDEPSVGQATFTLSLPGGVVFSFDASGNLTVTTPGHASIRSTGPMTISSTASVEVSAPQIALDSASVSLGGGLGGGAPLALKSEVEDLRNELQEHVHGGVQGGGGTSGPPTSSFTQIVGTLNANGV